MKELTKEILFKEWILIDNSEREETYIEKQSRETEELIESRLKYIRYAIKNGFKYHWRKLWANCSIWFHYPNEVTLSMYTSDIDSYTRQINFYELITSKLFIEAITILVIKDQFTKNATKDQIEYTLKSESRRITNVITQNQAEAIRENKMDEFIKELLPN